MASTAQPTASISNWLQSLTSEQILRVKQGILRGEVDLSDLESKILLTTWEFWARKEQLPPAGAWTFWMILAGRGFGKTRAGGEWLRDRATSGRFQRVNMIAATADDARDIMIEGESGIMAICPPWQRPTYRITKSKLDWPNGCESLIFTAVEPERLRGKQHESLWADELASWRYPEAWDQAMLGLRIGPDPRAVVTTTPKPTRLVRDLMSDPACVVTRGTTYDNRENLAPAFFQTVIRKYEGTRLGRQELKAEILDETPGALWKRELITYARGEEFNERRLPADLTRVVVGVDPAGGEDDEDLGTSEVGIVAAGVGADQQGYVLEDRSAHGSPETWAKIAVGLYHQLKADMLVAETNYGGAMVRAVIHAVDSSVNVKVVTASRGKTVRAEPVAAFYEQGRVSHARPFADLEDQMCTYVPGMKSPDRMDALVWCLNELMVDQHGASVESYREPVRGELTYRRGGLELHGDRFFDDEPAGDVFAVMAEADLLREERELAGPRRTPDGNWER